MDETTNLKPLIIQEGEVRLRDSLFGDGLLTWDDVETLDDTVSRMNREVIKGLEREERVQCPYLRKEGYFFYYCQASLSNYAGSKPINSPRNGKFRSGVDSITLQLTCFPKGEEIPENVANLFEEKKKELGKDVLSIDSKKVLKKKIIKKKI